MQRPWTLRGRQRRSATQHGQEKFQDLHVGSDMVRQDGAQSQGPPLALDLLNKSSHVAAGLPRLLGQALLGQCPLQQQSLLLNLGQGIV